MYSFVPTEEQKMLVDVIGRYARNDLRPSARENDETGELPVDLIEKGWELGTLQASIPGEFGGFGEYSVVTGVLAAEEFAYGDLAGALAVLIPGMFAIPVLLAGSPDQKQAYLPGIVEDKWNPYTAAMIEQQFDFDPQDLGTRAVLKGDSYEITGEKSYVPYALDAELILVYASLEGETQGFIIPAKSQGLKIGERQKLLGIHALPVYVLHLDGVKVPHENRLGGPEGHDFAPLLAAQRVANAALAIGVSRAAFEYSREYAKDREVFGVKVAQKQAIAFMLAEMATEIEAIRLLTWEAAWMIDQGKDEAAREAYLADYGAADMAMMVTDRAVQILGGHGYIREHPVEMWMRNGRGLAALTGLAIV
jgi:alkylation response protein AidB-like acyl-CoA dehydrogenase